MTQQSRLSELITQLGTDYKTFKTWLFGSTTGNLTGLTTTDKTSLMHAINEVNAKPTGTSAQPASTTVAGISQRASNAEALAMTATDRDLSPSNLAAIVNVNNGLLKLDSTGKVAAAQLPAYVDDVLEVANFAALPGTGTAGVIYVTLDNNKVFRWGGSAYAEISASPGSTDAVPEGATNLYYTATRADTRADARITARIGNEETDLVALYTAAKA